MPKQDKERFTHPRELIHSGLVMYLAGFIFSALDKFEYGYIRGDAFWLGNISVATGIILWASFNTGRPKIGRVVVRSFFLLVVMAWIYASSNLLASDLHIGVAIFLSIALGVLVLGVWMLTWWPTLTIKSEQCGSGQPATRPEFE